MSQNCSTPTLAGKAWIAWFEAGRQLSARAADVQAWGWIHVSMHHSRALQCGNLSPKSAGQYSQTEGKGALDRRFKRHSRQPKITLEVFLTGRQTGRRQ